VEMFVGVGASRVRDTFLMAKKAAPSIIFIDELDAIGRHRGAGLGGGHDEREQTLNQILVELDGFEPHEKVIVISATNRPDILDPALLRPGRFDRRVVVDLPDLNDREQILKIHSQKKKMAKDVNLRRIAERTPGLSGADLQNIENEAAILAARENRKEVRQSDLTDAIEKVMLGPERKSHILSKKEKEISAYHEAGHALTAAAMPEADPVHKVSIVSRGRAAGFTMKLPIEDRHLYSRSHFLAELVMSLGGYASEKEVFKEITTGASDDLRKATDLARALVTKYGMSDKIGPISFGEQDEMIFLGKEIGHTKNYSEKVAVLIDDEVSRLMNEAFKRAGKIIKDKRKTLDAIAKHLIEKETIERDDFEKLMASFGFLPKKLAA
ncbi:MAG: AAA family ATPase, partial [Patescibacteria group bacterium]